jgi:hypothetical protein
MDNDTKITLKWLSPILILFIFAALFLATCHPIIGLFPESHFRLSSDSRFPKWFEIPPNYTREDLTVEIYYFIDIFGTDFKAILLGPGPEYKKLDKKLGTHRWHPISEEKIKTMEGRLSKPHYVIAKINGVEEIIEHKVKGPVFHISDNPSLKTYKR